MNDMPPLERLAVKDLRDEANEEQLQEDALLNAVKDEPFSGLPTPAELLKKPGWVSVQHFAPAGPLRRLKYTRKKPAVGALYDHNPAPSMKLAHRASALQLTDAKGCMVWLATEEANNPNRDWIREYQTSDVYEAGDAILLFMHPSADSYTVFPEEGWYEFWTALDAVGERVQELQRVRAYIKHTSHYKAGVRARKTCYVVVRNGVLEYAMP